MSLLALLSQPVDQSPTSVGGVDVAWSAAAPVLVLVGGALLLLAAGALSRRPPISGVYALVHRHRGRRRGRGGGPALAARPGRGPRSVLHAGSRGGRGRVLGVRDVHDLRRGDPVALLLDGWLRREGMEGTEPYVLVLLSASGGVMMASANDLIVMFLGLEILSIAVYVLAAMHLRKVTSQEAGVKYFVLGAFSSAFFLYGIALDLRRHRVHQPRGDLGVPVHHRAGQQRAAPRRHGAAPRGLRVQGRGRAVPLLDARRVPGRAHARAWRGWPRA